MNCLQSIMNWRRKNAKYNELAAKEEKVIFGGRLGMYQYFDMWKVIEEALKLVNNFNKV